MTLYLLFQRKTFCCAYASKSSRKDHSWGRYLERSKEGTADKWVDWHIFQPDLRALSQGQTCHSSTISVTLCWQDVSWNHETSTALKQSQHLCNNPYGLNWSWARLAVILKKAILERFGNPKRSFTIWIQSGLFIPLFGRTWFFS